MALKDIMLPLGILLGFGLLMTFFLTSSFKAEDSAFKAPQVKKDYDSDLLDLDYDKEKKAEPDADPKDMGGIRLNEYPTTTTTVVSSNCGNGVLDEGEECDPGTICSGFDGICKEVGGRPFAYCFEVEECDWDVQMPTGSKHDLGGCTGCYQKNNPKGCTCFNPQTLA